MKKLILHLGRAKTGSSSLQNTFGAANRALRKQGVMYPPFLPYNHSFQFTVLFKSNPRNTFYYRQFSPANEAEWEAEKARLTKRWTQFFECAPGGTWIVSAENLPAMSVKEIEAVLAFVGPFFDGVEAIAYVRHPESVLRSQWEEFVKVMTPDTNGRELLADTVRDYNFRFLNRWSRVLGEDKITVRPFDPKRFVGGSLLSDFVHHTGLGELDLPVSEPVANESLGVEGAALLQAYNLRYPLYRDGGVNPERGLVRHLDELYSAMRAVPTRPLAFPVRFNAEEAGHTNRQIELVNRYLAPGDRFEPVREGAGPTELPEPADIPIEYFIELINQFALRIDGLLEQR